MRKHVFLAALVGFALVLSPAAAFARDEADSDSDSDLSRLERRQGELFIADDVLDPSFEPLEDPADQVLVDEGNSDSVIEEPLDPDEPEAAETQRVVAGEIQDETDKAMERDHFDDSTTPFEGDQEGVGEGSRDPVEW